METNPRHNNSSSSSGTRLLITVHGIRTFGLWQERLEDQFRRKMDENLEVCHYRYGFFTILGFLIPPFRWILTKRFQLDLLHQASRLNWKRIDIVAHSFGTHLVAWALMRTPKSARPSIHTIIFAGSVLRSSFPLRELVGSCVRRLVNDCGIRDNVLLANQLFILFTGMAGRVGLSGMESEYFRNRYFDFGHSGYFQHTRDGKPDFISNHWLPILESEAGIPAHNDRKHNRLQDLVTIILNNAEPIKLAGYILPLLIVLAFVNRLRVDAQNQARVANVLRAEAQIKEAIERKLRADAQQQTAVETRLRAEAQHQASIEENLRRASQHSTSIAVSRQLGAVSGEARIEDADPVPPVLLAVESMRRNSLLDNEQLLRESAQLLPRQIWEDSNHSHVESVAISPNRQFVATGSSDGITRVYIAQNGKLVWASEAQINIEFVTFSPDGRRVATRGVEGIACVYDVESGKEVWRSPKQKDLGAIAFSPDGLYFAIASETNATIVFQTATWREAWRDSGHDANGLAFSPNGKLLATAFFDGKVRVFLAESGQELSEWKKPARRFTTLAFSPDGKLFGVGGLDDDGAWLVDAASGREVARLDGGAILNSIAFDPNGHFVVTGNSLGSLRVFDLPTAREIKRLEFRNAIESAAFSSSGSYLAIASWDNTARLFEVPTWREVTRVAGWGPMESVAISADDQHVAIGGWDGATRYFEIPSVRGETRINRSHIIAPLVFSGDGRFIAASTVDDEVRIFAAESAEEVSRIPQQGATATITFSPTSRYIATRSEKDIIDVFDTASGNAISHMYQKGADSVAFTRDELQLAIGGSGSAVNIYEVGSGELTSTLSREGLWNGPITFAPDGKSVAIAGPYADPRRGSMVGFGVYQHDLYMHLRGEKPLPDVASAHIFDLKTRKEVWHFIEQEDNGEQDLTEMAFSPDGRRLMTATNTMSQSGDTVYMKPSPLNTIRMFNVASGREEWEKLQHGGTRQIAFSLDDKLIATGNSNHLVRIFEVAGGREVHRWRVDRAIDAINFGPDDLNLIVASFDSSGIVLTKYPLLERDIVEDACSKVTRNLTLDEWRRFVGPEVPYHKTCPSLP
jgi:WD40 repeat protein